MPCPKAVLVSGGSLSISRVRPAPIPIFAKRSMSSFSEGCVGQNWRRKLSCEKSTVYKISSKIVPNFLPQFEACILIKIALKNPSV